MGHTMEPLDRIDVINGKRYNTETATLLAGDDYWDGSNWERRGTNLFLFRTPKGAYFTQTRSQWQGSDDGALSAVDDDEAQRLFEGLREKRVTFEDAFPQVEIQDA